MNEPDLADALSNADSPKRWFFRGTAVGMLLMASINALSYFFRSADWSSLVGQSKLPQEAVGFPFIVWEAGNSYGGMFADYPNLGAERPVCRSDWVDHRIDRREEDRVLESDDHGDADRGEPTQAPTDSIHSSRSDDCDDHRCGHRHAGTKFRSPPRDVDRDLRIGTCCFGRHCNVASTAVMA